MAFDRPSDGCIELRPLMPQTLEVCWFRGSGGGRRRRNRNHLGRLALKGRRRDRRKHLPTLGTTFAVTSGSRDRIQRRCVRVGGDPAALSFGRSILVSWAVNRSIRGVHCEGRVATAR